MPLVEALPYGEAVRRDPPTRLDLSDVVLPPDVDLTLVGTIHDGSCSSADYAAELFNGNYLYLSESYNWDPEVQKRLQRISRGYFNALEDTRALESVAIELGSDLHRNNARWNYSVHEALYKSGVRVMMADVSEEDIRSGRVTDRATYQSTAMRVTQSGVTGLPISEEDLVIFAERDAIIAGAICEAIPKLRREDPKLDPNTTLKAVGMYGTVHVQSVADALTALAEAQDTDSFTINTKYEVAVPNSAEGIDELELEDRRMRIAGMIGFYSDWLRTEPVEPGTIWYPNPDLNPSI
jgi:hypothetical protein